MQSLINFHAIIENKIISCYYKNQNTLGIAETTGEQIILIDSEYEKSKWQWMVMVYKEGKIHLFG